MSKIHSMFKLTFIFCVLIFLSFGCSEDVEQRRWDFNNYFEILKGDDFYGKYKDIRIMKLRPNKKKLRGFEYKDSVVIVFDWEEDYSYDIKYFVDKQTGNYMFISPSHIKETFEEAISDCKELQLFGFYGNENSFEVKFYMRNINRNSLPESLKQIEWISDSTMASFEFGPELKMVSTDEIVGFPLNDKWYFTAYRTDIWNTEWP